MSRCSAMERNKEEFDFSKFRGLIRANNISERDFARSISRTPKFLSDVFCGKAVLTMFDITNSCVLLNIPAEEIGSIFFVLKSHKCEN